MSGGPPGMGEVVLVVVGLDPPPDRVARLAATLSARERERAGRRRTPVDRRRAVVSRGLLREVLGRATGREPREVDLRATAVGRPHLAGEEVAFSLAHCGDTMLVALARDRPVGVDLERHRPVAGLREVAARLLEPGAAAALQALPEARRPAALIDWWVRGEAYGKARGTGVAHAGGLSLSPSAAGPARVRAVGGQEPGGVWGVQDLAVGPGWSAALAAAGCDWRVVGGGARIPAR